MLYKASAPGSLMLLGEYAVLHGKPAIVCAVDKRLSVSLSPRQDNKIHIKSALGELTCDVTNIPTINPFQFVCAVLQKYQNELPSGCDIEITSEFSSTIGFGSSAAITVALLSAITTWINEKINKAEIAYQAREIIRKVQGTGSGADVAACTFGGVIAYCAEPFTIESLPNNFSLTVMYSGSKTPTVEAIKHVENKFNNKSHIFHEIISEIETCAIHGKKAILNQNWKLLGDIMSTQQVLMEKLGVNTIQLENLISQLKTDPAILGAKISGSGLGDCVIGLGNAVTQLEIIPVNIAQQGVYCEKI